SRRSPGARTSRLQRAWPGDARAWMVAGYHNADDGASGGRRCDKTPPSSGVLAISAACRPGRVARLTFVGVQSHPARMTDWDETVSIGAFRSEDLAKPDAVFRYNRYLYRTTGKHLSNGGMGTVYELERRDDATGAIEAVVGKVFHANYLFQLR